VLRRRSDPDKPVDEHSSTDQPAETLAASVGVLKESITDLRALTDEEALDLRGRMRALEHRVSLVEARLEDMSEASPDARILRGAAAGSDQSVPGPANAKLDAARARKADAKRRFLAARKRRLAARKSADSLAMEDKQDDQHGAEDE
jgi:hypothetical protein